MNTKADKPIPPCPMPGCGAKCKEEKINRPLGEPLGLGTVSCSKCCYSAPSIDAHRQVCAAIELAEDLSDLRLSTENENVSCAPNDTKIVDNIIMKARGIKAIQAGKKRDGT